MAGCRFTKEFSALAQVNDDALFAVPAAGGTWQCDSNGIFRRGILSQRIGDAYANPFGRRGIRFETLRFERDRLATTQDFAFDVEWSISDHYRVNFEAQRIEPDLRQDAINGTMNSWANIAIDNTGRTPQVQLLAPRGRCRITSRRAATPIAGSCSTVSRATKASATVCASRPNTT